MLSCNNYFLVKRLVSALKLGIRFALKDLMFIQVIVSGKLRAQRAKSMKFKDGYMISSGQPVNEYIDSAVRHVLLRQVLVVSKFHTLHSINNVKWHLFSVCWTEMVSFCSLFSHN